MDSGLRDFVESETVHPEYREAVKTAISALGDLGGVVEEVSLPLIRHCGSITTGISAQEWASLRRRTFTGHLEELDHNTRIRYLRASVIPSQVYYKAQKLRSLVRRQVLEALEGVDVLVSPTGPVPAPPVESAPGVHSKEEAAAELAGRSAFTGPFNLAGLPALSVPCGFTSSGLPLGLQIGGRAFAEETVMKVAYAYEQHTTWHTKRPPV